MMRFSQTCSTGLTSFGQISPTPACFFGVVRLFHGPIGPQTAPGGGRTTTWKCENIRKLAR